MPAPGHAVDYHTVSMLRAALYGSVSNPECDDSIPIELDTQLDQVWAVFDGAMQDGTVRLPDVYVRDKNDTFQFGGRSYSTFRLLARAVRRDAAGMATPIISVMPAISPKFVVRYEIFWDLSIMLSQHQAARLTLLYIRAPWS